jgi:glycosyltransferase involved in cell wall biosynthesis
MPSVAERCPTQAPLRLALVTETYPPEVNGVSMTVARVVEGMRSRGHEVQLVRLRQGESESDRARSQGRYREVLMRGMPIPRYPHLRMGLPWTPPFRRLWSADRPDLVHIATEGPLGWSALRAARSLGIPVTSDFRTNFHAYMQHYGVGLLGRPMLAYLRHFHSQTACTMVPTESLRRELIAQGFKHLSVAARGVDTVRFDPRKRSDALRQSWGVGPQTTVALCVGRLAAEKNLATLVAAYEAMRRIEPGTRLVMVGDGPARHELQAACPDAILAGSRTGDDLSAHYASADVFLFPSLTETFGNVTPEAMASGLPVLAFDYAAAAQIIRSGDNGLLAPFGSAEQFVQQAERLVSDRAHARRMGVAARRAAEQLGWDAVITQVESIFMQVARGAQPTASVAAAASMPGEPDAVCASVAAET